MSFAVTSLGSLGDTNGRSNYTCTTSRAPAANSLVLVSVLGANGAGTAVEPTSVAGAGLTFALIGSSITFNTIASGVHNLSLWRALGTPDSSLITAAFSSSFNGCAMLVTEVSGTSTGGTNGSRGVGASNTSVSDLSVRLMVTAGQSAASTVNAWFSTYGQATTSTATLDNNYTQIDTTNHLTPSTGIYSAWTTRATGSQLTWYGGSNQNRAGIIVELVADNPPIPLSGYYRRRYQQTT